MKKLLLTLVLTGFCGLTSFGQTTLNGFSNTEVFQWQTPAKSGTYEFQQTTKGELAYTTDFMDRVLRLIELERRDDEDLYVVYNDHLTIFIPSKSSIAGK